LVFNPEKKAAAITERGVFGSLSSQTSVTAITDTSAPVGDNGIDLWCQAGVCLSSKAAWKTPQRHFQRSLTT
jgi:hypothetical protein